MTGGPGWQWFPAGNVAKDEPSASMPLPLTSRHAAPHKQPLDDGAFRLCGCLAGGLRPFRHRRGSSPRTLPASAKGRRSTTQSAASRSRARRPLCCSYAAVHHHWGPRLSGLIRHCRWLKLGCLRPPPPRAPAQASHPMLSRARGWCCRSPPPWPWLSRMAPMAPRAQRGVWGSGPATPPCMLALVIGPTPPHLQGVAHNDVGLWSSHGPVAARMEGSAWRNSHSMVFWPLDLSPSDIDTGAGMCRWEGRWCSWQVVPTCQGRQHPVTMPLRQFSHNNDNLDLTWTNREVRGLKCVFREFQDLYYTSCQVYEPVLNFAFFNTWVSCVFLL